MKKRQKLTSPIDKAYIADSKPFTIAKQTFTEADLHGLNEYRRLLSRLHGDDTAKAEFEYQRKVQTWLKLKFKVSAPHLVDIEVELLRQIVGDTEEPPPMDDAIDDGLHDWFIEALTERLA